MKNMIGLDILNHVAVIAINCPPSNALSGELLKELDLCIGKVEEEHSVRAVILTGTGKFFSAGANLKELSQLDANNTPEQNRFGQHVFCRVETLPVPVIAAINGFALGGGLELSLACDIRIASEQAKLGLPETTLGLVPAYGGLSRLAYLIGEGCAKTMIFTGDIIAAQEAEHIGLVQEIVPHEHLMERCMELAQKICAASPDAVRFAKNIVYKRRTCSLELSLEHEVVAFSECMLSNNGKEGIGAFLEHRTPVYED